MTAQSDLVGRFPRAAASLRRAQCRPEIELVEISAPTPRASDSVAFSATVLEPGSAHPSSQGSAEDARELATGRFLLIHAPDRGAEWGDAFRIVTYVKAEVEREFRRSFIRLPDDEMKSFLQRIAERQHFDTVEDFYAAIGYGGVSLIRMMPHIKDEYNKIVKASAPPEISRHTLMSLPTWPPMVTNGSITTSPSNLISLSA